uniref:CC-NBS-LRR protein n=1 Tax=Solanum tuberosum TaxID=4113 RepID=A6YP90_SOLTU|nr:CC-NBS-LRR protein [Solanum tuberosum]
MDIGLAVGGAFLSSVLQVLFDRLAPQGELLKMFRRNKHDLRILKKLRMTLLSLQAVLSDAENKQASNPYVSQWLNELQHAVDSAENLIEEVNYEVLRLKVEGDQCQNLGETRHPQASRLSLSLSDDFFLNIKAKLEDNIETLEELQKQIGFLDLKSCLDSGKQETRRPSTSLVDESDIFGRQNEVEELIGRLLSGDANGKKLTVIPIVGMGGVGRTTLAKAVYNDEKVKDHFDLKAWICVSEPYDAVRITKELLQEIRSFDCMINNTLNQLQIELKESLKGKKFLIVLDDVWNDNYDEWDDLRSTFVQGDIGSKIIVTTRKESVALMMGCGEMNVGTLSSEVSWALFKRHSLENREPEEHTKLEEIGKQIAHKCKGLPLALKAIAGILRSKSEVDEWKDILRSEIWELPSCSNGILPALMLSYNDLPAHLKWCFAFCAIYPKDYLFCKEQVIHLWIANGIVQQLDSGNQFFVELRSRTLFERVRESSEWNPGEFLMHDLVNDLAQIASSNLCIRLEDIKASHMLERTRHLSYSMGDGDFGKLKTLNKLEQLRTLLPINIQWCLCRLSKRGLHDILPRLTSLRALSLSHSKIEELPNDLFIKFKHLRFLDLSSTKIKKLPDSICVLYNLETLLLSHCSYLKELPLQMEKLINLRHLDISKAQLKTPLHLSKLKNLHVLVGAKVFLTGSSGLRIEDLGELHYLYGSLSIIELQNVIDRREAHEAYMREKEHVEKLSLEWSVSIANNSQNERDILDELQPNTNIKELQIAGYRGTKFPNWLADHSFHKLMDLSLSDCKDCDSLPALGQLPSLKFLTIRGMHQIAEVSEEFYGSLSSKKPFNSLEKLGFAEMQEWKQWHVLGNGEFPILEELWINGCPKLIGKLPENLPSLTRLRISKCPEFSLEAPIQLSNLKEFKVIGCPKVGVLFDDAQLFTSQLEGMKQIVELSITDCHSLTSLPISILPITLKKIEIHHCGKLKLEMPVNGCCNMFLENLQLHECDSIDDISPELVPRARSLRVEQYCNPRLLIPSGTEELCISLCENLEILIVACGTQMTSLDSYNCVKLKSLPEHMQELLPFLKELTLDKCPEIVSFPEGGLPFNLQVLWINNCKKLVNRRNEWRLQRLPSLRQLGISHDGSDEEVLAGEIFELPCSIRSLYISNLKTLSSQLLRSLTSLESLCVNNLPQMQSLLEEGLPVSLSELELYFHHDRHSLPTEGLQHLKWLQSLAIFRCPNLQSLARLGMPSSLSELVIIDCPSLRSLPVSGMPSSISALTIYKCPLLKPLLEFDKGEY